MTDDQTRIGPAEPGVPTVATRVAGEHLIAADVLQRLDGRTDPADIESAIRESVRHLGNLVPSYVLPERPVEVLVRIADEAGIEVEQTLNLTRAQGGTPEVLGGAVGHAVASALAGFYIAADGAEHGDALAAAATTLGTRR